jgi:hypothetical protein
MVNLILLASSISCSRGARHKTASTSWPHIRRYHLFFTNFKIYISFSYFFAHHMHMGAAEACYHSTHPQVVSALLALLELLWAPVEHYRSQLEHTDGGSLKAASQRTGMEAEHPVYSAYCLWNCCLQQHH